MTQRRVEFHIDPGGVLAEQIPLCGGVKGEHNSTVVAFVATTATLPYTDNDCVRLSFLGGDGTVLSSDFLEPLIDEDTGHISVSYALPKLITMLGGQVEVRLVMSTIEDSGKETQTFITDAAVLYFEDAAVENGTPFWTGVSEMLKRVASYLKNTYDHMVRAYGYMLDAQTARDNAAASATQAGESVLAAQTARDEAVAATATTMRYKGHITGPGLYGSFARETGDVYYCITDGKYYMWVGTGWDEISCVTVDISVTETGTNPVSGAAVSNFVKAQIKAYDTEAMALLGEEEAVSE